MKKSSASAVEEAIELSNTPTKQETEKVAIEDMLLNTLRDYRLYNEEARRMNKKLKICRYAIKPCPVELHPHQRVVFRRNDQPSNPLPVYVSDEKIHFDKKLIPGKTYDLPEYIIHYLSEKGDPQWKWYDNADGSRETRISHKAPRFSLTPVYQE